MKKKTKNNIKKAFGVWGRVVSSTVLCAFLYFSVLMVVNIVFTPEIGYRVTQTDTDGKTEVVEEHFYQDGEDPSMEVELEEGQRRTAIRGDISAGTATTVNIILLVLMLVMVGVFPYNAMWNLGSSDVNKVKFGRKKKDLLRGLKIGSMATVPAALLYVVLIFAKYGVVPSAYLSVYRFLNLPYLPYINWVTPATSALEVSWLSLLLIAATLLFVPAVCTVGYVLGYRDFSVHEHLIYQKKVKEETDEEI